MIATIKFEVDGTKHPTDDGRYLHINSGDIIGSLSLSFDPRSSSDDFPTDVVNADFRTADSGGDVWSMQSRFTSELFIIHMIDLSSTVSDLFPIASAPNEYREAFQNDLLLEDVRFSSDDRFNRRLLLGNDIFEIQFNNTTISLDIAVIQDEDQDYSYLTKLGVKIHGGSLYSGGEDLGEFGFYLDLKHLLNSNTAVYSNDYTCWKDSPIPLPSLFQLTNDKSKEQDNVLVVSHDI